MLKGITFLSTLAISACLALPSWAEGAPNADTVVARIDGVEITLGHMIIAHATLPQRYQQLPAETLYNALLDQLIQQSALSQTHTGKTPRHIELSLENERRSLLAAEQIEKIMKGAASEDDIRAQYDADYSDGFGGKEYNASHILLETKEDADSVKSQLDSGADFATLAREYSTGPSGPSGGSLGWFGTGAMVPEFEQAVVSLEEGEVSAPVQTQFGWHVIILNESRQSSAPKYDEVRAEIADKLRKDAVEATVERLTQAAEIERPRIPDLDPEVIRNLDLLGN